ncbi:MAG TPA: FtsX-like permease family protein, partial [Candidatus Sulfopaludibacter sp.]|nr:FtsX-like permease family protein [Candidatus Sulfopaludibacter sp.]
FGSIPALNAVKTDPITPLRQGGATVGGSSRTGRLLVMVQVALSLVLVVAATLFTGTLRDLKSQALGFNSSHVLGMALINRPDGYRGIDQVSYYRDLCERLAKVPGVRSVSSSSLPPVMPPFLPDQTVAAGDTAIGAQEILVAPGFFETMQIPLVAGRDFTFHDTAQTPRLAVLSESLARRLSVTVDQHVSLAGRDVQITGIVSDSGVGSLQKHNSSQVFTSTLQLESGPSTPYFLVRAAGVPTAMLAQQLSTEVESMGREYPIRIESMDRAIARALVQERLMASLGGGFGVLALILAVIGLYGLMSYTVVRRSRDIGVRLALGADPRGIVRMVVGEALTLVAAGLAMGIPAVYAASKTASAMLQGLNPLGVAPLAIASAVLLAAALLAAALPAHRAAKLDPMAALRE